MLLRIFVTLFVLSLTFVAPACADKAQLVERHELETNERPSMYRVIAGDVCTGGIPGMHVEAQYLEDFVSGKVGSLSKPAIGFYIGDYPDLSKAVSEQPIRIENPEVIDAVLRKHADGRYTVALGLKERKRPTQSVVFWDSRDFTKDPTFLHIVESLKICDIR